MARKLDLMLGMALAAFAAPASAADTPGEAPGDAASGDLAYDHAFAPPAGPMILTRELRRTLADGKEFVARRSYRISFVPAMDGYRVDGILLSSEVEAPADLMPLAELERTREGGPFPLTLDQGGRIVAQAADETPAQAERTLAAASTTLSASGLSEEERGAALRMVAQLQSRARTAGVTWPADLFRPAAAGRSESALPTAAGTGSVVVTTEGRTDRSGLLRRLERRIVTELAGSSRTSIERWTLAPAP